MTNIPSTVYVCRQTLPVLLQSIDTYFVSCPRVGYFNLPMICLNPNSSFPIYFQVKQHLYTSPMFTVCCGWWWWWWWLCILEFWFLILIEDWWNCPSEVPCTELHVQQRAFKMGIQRKIAPKKTVGNSAEHKQSQPLPCNKCLKTFQSASELAIHKALHSEPSRVSCETCQKTFTSQKGLNRHVKLHSEETAGRLACEKCGKLVPDQSHLKRHQRQVWAVSF